MKVKVEWTREVRGYSEVEVDDAEVLEWANDLMGDGKKMADPPITEVTPELVKDFLGAGDGQELEAAIRWPDDIVHYPWYGYDVEAVEAL